ncbi:MAG: glycosyltransferase [Dehalococcoidia bacterium]|jgi:glycosyltransferase involved in cell wall biosynthesis
MDNINTAIRSAPAVTIVIPTFNRSFILGRAIKSVLNQTYPHFELIIVDDCSTDNTEEIVRSFSDERIRYLRHNKNSGVSAARNTGIIATQNKYVSFLDDDDELLPAFLEKQMEAIVNAAERVGVIYADLLTEYYQGYRRSVTNKEGNIYKKALRLNFDVPMQSLLIKVDCFKTAGLFDEDLTFAEDIDMVIRLSRHFQFIHVDQPLVIKHATAGAMCCEPGVFIRGFKALLDKHTEELKKDGQALSQFYLHIGHFLFVDGQEREARQYICKAMGASPCNLKAVGVYLMVLLGRNRYNRVKEMYISLKYPWLKL